MAPSLFSALALVYSVIIFAFSTVATTAKVNNLRVFVSKTVLQTSFSSAGPCQVGYECLLESVVS